MKTAVIWHRYFFVATLLTTIAYSSLSLRDYVDGKYSGRAEAIYVHGWPQVFLERHVSKLGPSSRFNILESVHRFYPLPFLFNLLFVVCLSLLSAWLWHVHCLNRRFWQFSLKEVLLITTAFCLGIGSYLWLRHDYVEEEHLLAELQNDGWSLRYTDDYLPWYLQPLHDFGIIDADKWASFELAWETNSLEEDSELAERLKKYASNRYRFSYVASVTIEDPSLDDENLRQLCTLIPNCRSLDLIRCSQITRGGFERLGNDLPRLKELGVRSTPLTDGLIKGITTISTLEILEIDGECPFCIPGWARQLSALKHLRTLRIPAECLEADADKEYLREAHVPISNEPH